MRTWHHGHSIATGAIFSLAFVNDHALWLLTAAFAGGLVVGRGWWAIGRLMRTVAGRLRPHASRALYRPKPW